MYKECSLYYKPNPLFIECNRNGLLTLKEGVRYERKKKGYELVAESKNGFAYSYYDCIDAEHRKIKRLMTNSLCRALKTRYDEDYYNYLAYQEEFYNYRKPLKENNGLNIDLEFLQDCKNKDIDLIADLFSGKISLSQYKGMLKQYIYDCAKNNGNADKLEQIRHNYDVSTYRTSKILKAIAYNNPWTYFITLTIDSKKCDRYSFEKSSSLIRETMAYLVKKCKRKDITVKYMLVPEMHKDGAFHFHGMLYVDDIARFEKSEISSIVADKYFLKLFNEKCGFSDIQAIKNSMASTKYMAKYINKCVQDSNSIRNLFVSVKMLYASAGLDKGTEEFVTDELQNTEKHNSYVVDENTGEYKEINSYNTFIDISAGVLQYSKNADYSPDTMSKVYDIIKTLYERGFFNNDVQEVWENGFVSNVDC